MQKILPEFRKQFIFNRKPVSASFQFSIFNFQLFMKSLLFFALSIFCFGLQAQTGTKEPDLKSIVDGKFRAAKISQVQPLPDGEHYTMLSKDHTKILKYSYKTGKEVETLFDIQTARECTIDHIDGYLISNTGFRIVLWNNTESVYRRSWKADIYDYDVRRNMIKPLSDQSGKLMLPTFSPDGRMCSFVRDNNIWLKKFDFDTESQVTKDGSFGKILNGLSDWVYEEEFRVTNCMAWSSDSKILAFVKSDESAVETFTFQNFDGSSYPGLVQYKYPKAGTANSSVSVHAYSVETKDIKKMNLQIEPDAYIPRIVFTNNPEQLAIMCLNRQQNVFSMYYANPKSAICKMILKDENQAYIDSDWLNSIYFTDTHFTYVSESDGYAHIYLYGVSGVPKKQITSGSWDVTRLLGIHPADQTIYFESAEENSMRRSVYKIDAKGKKVKLTPQIGFNQASFSTDFSYFINDYSNSTTPDKISIYDASGKELVVLEDNSSVKSMLSQYTYRTKEFITIPTVDQYELNAWIIKPTHFSASRKYPVLMVQYSGPNSQEVLDKYDFDWEQYLAEQGFVVVCVDGRGTGARGEFFRKCTYMKLGYFEANDQINAARWLSKQSYVDSNRIAIWGWSFGGTVSLLSMSLGNGTFKAGIAIAPVTDWRFYDTVYSERYMRTPNENTDGYMDASPSFHASKLEGRLLLVHGTSDDNVHFQNSLYYSDILVNAGKQFDMQVYSGKNHSLPDKTTRLHLYNTCYRFLKENL